MDGASPTIEGAEKEKLELSEALLEKIEALKKMMEDTSDLCNIILER